MPLYRGTKQHHSGYKYTEAMKASNNLEPLQTQIFITVRTIIFWVPIQREGEKLSFQYPQKRRQVDKCYQFTTNTQITTLDTSYKIQVKNKIFNQGNITLIPNYSLDYERHSSIGERYHIHKCQFSYYLYIAYILKQERIEQYMFNLKNTNYLNYIDALMFTIEENYLIGKHVLIEK